MRCCVKAIFWLCSTRYALKWNGVEMGLKWNGVEHDKFNTKILRPILIKNGVEMGLKWGWNEMGLNMTNLILKFWDLFQ